MTQTQEEKKQDTSDDGCGILEIPLSLMENVAKSKIVRNAFKRVRKIGQELEKNLDEE